MFTDVVYDLIMENEETWFITLNAKNAMVMCDVSLMDC